MSFSPAVSAAKSPASLIQSQGSLTGLDFDAFTLSERDDVALSATESPHNPSTASHASETESLSPKEPTSPQAGSNLYVASLPETCTDAQLLQLFAPFGPVISAKVMCRKGTNLCKGYGFVLFRREEDAAVAQTSMIGRVVDGSKIQVRRAHMAASVPLLNPTKPPTRASQASARADAAAAPALAADESATRARGASQTSLYPTLALPPPSWQASFADACPSNYLVSPTLLPASTPQSPQVQWSYAYSAPQSNYASMWSPMMMSAAAPPPPHHSAPQVVYIMVPSMNSV